MTTVASRIGSRVVLKACPGTLRQFAAMTGEVKQMWDEQAVAYVEFTEGEVVPVPIAYLAPAPTDAKPKRRSPLNLRMPADDRTEAQRLADGAHDLEAIDPTGQFAYTVMRVNQGASPAICHKCSRLSRERGGPAMVQISCKTCGSRGFSPSTNSTFGVPDTFVFRLDWPRLVMMGVEWKDAENGRRTEAQSRLEAAGRIVVVWDTPSLFAAVHQFESEDPRITPHPQLAAWLGERKLFGAK